MPFDLKPCPFCGGTAIWNEYEALDPLSTLSGRICKMFSM